MASGQTTNTNERDVSNADPGESDPSSQVEVQSISSNGSQNGDTADDTSSDDNAAANDSPSPVPDELWTNDPFSGSGDTADNSFAISNGSGKSGTTGDDGLIPWDPDNDPSCDPRWNEFENPPESADEDQYLDMAPDVMFRWFNWLRVTLCLTCMQYAEETAKNCSRNIGFPSAYRMWLSEKTLGKPEMIELDEWANFLNGQSKEGYDVRELDYSFRMAEKLRQSAIHRRPRHMTVKQLEAAMKLPELLRHEERAKEVSFVFDTLRKSPIGNLEAVQKVHAMFLNPYKESGDDEKLPMFRILQKIQMILEVNHFRLAEREDPAWLAENGYSKPEQIELDSYQVRWRDRKLARQALFPNSGGELLRDTLDAVRNLRNTATHQKRTSPLLFCQHVRAAIVSLLILQNEVDAIKVEILAEQHLRGVSRAEVLGRLRKAYPTKEMSFLEILEILETSLLESRRGSAIEKIDCPDEKAFRGTEPINLGRRPIITLAKIAGPEKPAVQVQAPTVEVEEKGPDTENPDSPSWETTDEDFDTRQSEPSSSTAPKAETDPELPPDPSPLDPNPWPEFCTDYSIPIEPGMDDLEVAEAMLTRCESMHYLLKQHQGSANSW